MSKKYVVTGGKVELPEYEIKEDIAGQQWLADNVDPSSDLDVLAAFLDK